MASAAVVGVGEAETEAVEKARMKGCKLALEQEAAVANMHVMKKSRANLAKQASTNKKTTGVSDRSHAQDSD